MPEMNVGANGTYDRIFTTSSLLIVLQFSFLIHRKWCDRQLQPLQERCNICDIMSQKHLEL